jgi:hypothetical protein
VQEVRLHEGHGRLLRLRSSAFFASPARIISHALPATTASEIVRCSSGVIVGSVCSKAPPMRVGPVVRLAPPSIGYVRVELGRS